MPKCEICGRDLIYINNLHLKSHNITTIEYRKLYPNAIMVDKSKAIRNQFYKNQYWNEKRIAKLKEIYAWASCDELLSTFPEKSIKQIYVKAHNLKLKRLYRKYSPNHFILQYKNMKFNAHKDKNGYIVINNSEMGITNIRLHRFVWEYEKGKIPPNYDIHHINGDVGNNDISNLELILNVKHK